MGQELTRAQRLCGLSRIWSDVAGYYARFSALPPGFWDAQYLEFVHRVEEVQEDDPLAYYALLMRFISLLKDGHCYVQPPEGLLPPYRVPFGTGYEGGRHLLTSVPARYEGLLGGTILAVDGLPAEQYAAAYIEPYCWHERPKQRYSGWLLGYVIGATGEGTATVETDRGLLTVLRGVREEQISLPSLTLPETTTWEALYREDDVLTVYRTPDNLCVIRLPSFQTDGLADRLYGCIREHRLDGCAGFLLDVCGNPGGSSRIGGPVAQLFFPGSFQEGKYLTRRQTAAGCARGQYSAGGEEADMAAGCCFLDETAPVHWRGCPVYLPQPTAVLCDACTASAAETFVAAMKYENRAVLVGERTAGTNGQPLMRDLPGGGQYAVCTQICLLNGGEDYHNRGIRPDVPVTLTAEDAVQGRDRILEKGLEVIRRLCGLPVR